MGKNKNKCSLCHVKSRVKEFNNFFIINCRKCNVLMLVLKQHRSTLTTAEQQAADFIYKEYFEPKGLVPRNIGMRSCTAHWHEHYVTKRIRRKMGGR